MHILNHFLTKNSSIFNEEINLNFEIIFNSIFNELIIEKY